MKDSKQNLKFNLKTDEIEEIFWFSRNEAIKSAMSWFDLQAIETLTK